MMDINKNFHSVGQFGRITAIQSITGNFYWGTESGKQIIHLKFNN